MKMKLLSCVLILLLGVPLMAAPPKGKSAVQTAPLTVDNTTYVNVNRILMFVTNHGNFGRDLAGVFGNDYGTYWPYSSVGAILDGSNTTSPYYAGGLWVGAVDSASGDTLVVLSEYASEYVPGPMSGGTFIVDNPAFKVYKLYRDSLAGNPNSDYLNWPVDQGAPMAVDTTIDTITGDTTYSEPYPWMQGDQMCWSVFNDANPEQHHGNVDAGETEPLGIEVKQTIFAYDRQGTLGDIVIIKLQVYNKGARTLAHCFLSLWSDPDLGNGGDDLVGCDTLLGLGFCYNEAETDQKYAPTPPPCLGIDFFQGPLDSTGNEADTGRMWGRLWPGYKNKGLYSFNKYINGTDPDNYQQTYMFMEGLLAKQNGAPYVYDGDTLLFQCSGDPVTGEGDLDASGDDRRMMQTTGPITFRPGDSVEIYAALIVGGGDSRLNSITVMKQADAYAQKLYETGFNPPLPPVKPVVTVANLDNEISLSWTDTSEVDQGDFRFEGYTIWQGTSTNGPWTELATYDVVNDRTQSLIDTFPNAYAGTKLPMAMRKIGNTGLRYRYTTTADALAGGRLRNLTTYYFRVTAFSYAFWSPDSGTYVSAAGQVVPAGNRFLESETKLTIIPQAAAAGYIPAEASGDVIAVTHAGGSSDGVVLPEVIDPRALNGHTYRVTFGIDSVYDTLVDATDYFTYDTLTDTCNVEWIGGELVVTYCVDTILDSTTYDSTFGMNENWFWNLEDTTLGVMIVDSVFNLTGDDAYLVYDGFQLKVSGPAAGIKRIVETASASGPVDPPDNVGYSLNSTGEWYVSSDQTNNWARLNWKGLIGTDNWEFRFTTKAEGSRYYDWNTDEMVADTAPFQIWNLGFVAPGTANDPSDDVRINFSYLDDDASGGWSWGDRIYTWEVPYEDPDPEVPAYELYNYPADFHIGRIKFNDNSGGAISAPAPGTIVQFITNKPITPADVYVFTAREPGYRPSEAALDAIKAVPNPYYLFGPYDPAVGNSQIYFSHLPDKCTITIYNLAGDFINRIEKDDPSTSNAYWNVRTENNLPVASGIYIYVVDAPGFGQKVGKVAVFTEQQVLDIY
jgi:hypothetical protein